MSDLSVNPNLTPEVVKGQVNLALTRVGNTFQSLANEAASLELNEDNLSAIAAFLSKARVVKKVVVDEHTVIKEPLLRQTQMIDQSRREMEGEWDKIVLGVQAKYNAICRQIEERKRQAEQERQRIERIKQGISNNLLAFAQKIAACDTMQKLNDVQRKINLEKGAAQGKSKYMEFHDDWVSQLEGLNSAINNQKEKIVQLEKLRKQDATESNQAAMAAIEGAIEEGKVKVQEQAMEAATAPVSYTQEVMPDVKARRSTWKFEVKDIDLLQRVNPELVVVSLNEAKVRELMNGMKDKELKGKEEFIFGGIRFFLDKNF